MQVGGITTTEVCNISCSMCHFNGPTAVRKAGTLNPEQVRQYLAGIPKGQELSFAGTGEFFMDPNALDYLRMAVEYGHKPYILTNGQLLTPSLIDEILAIGVRLIRISVDAIDSDMYSKVRQGGDFSVILAACAYLKEQKAQYPSLRVEINNTRFLNTAKQEAQFVDFWRDKVDVVNFNAEYYDIFKFRNKFFEPTERANCEMSVYLLPTGQMAPCCAMMVYQHYHNVDWLPHIDDTTPEAAYEQFVGLYNDPESDFRKNICSKCDWWIMWAKDEAGNTPYWRSVQLSEPAHPEQTSAPSHLDEQEAILAHLKIQLAEARTHLTKLENSQIWKLRNSWTSLKQAVFNQHDPSFRSEQSDPSSELAQLQNELEELNAKISWIQTSKFWKLEAVSEEIKKVLQISK